MKMEQLHELVLPKFSSGLNNLCNGRDIGPPDAKDRDSLLNIFLALAVLK